jgi:hypothetical protein
MPGGKETQVPERDDAHQRPCFAGDNLVKEAEGWRCRVCETLWPADSVQWDDDDADDDDQNTGDMHATL